MQTTVVGDVFTKSELAIGIGKRIVTDFNLVEPIDKHLGVGLEADGILVLPPVVQVAVLIIVTALVVEAMGHLMSNDNTDSTIVESIVGIHVEEGFLQNTCREANLVGGGVIVSVNRLGSHAPLGLVDRLVNLGNHVGNVELIAPDHIGEVAVFLDFKPAVVSPLVGITYFYHDCGEFLDSALFRILTHPFCIMDTHCKSLFQVVDHLDHAVLGFRGEETGHIEFTQCFAHGTVNSTGDAFPAGTQLLSTTEGATVEVEIGVDEVTAQIRCSSVDDIPGIIGLNGIKAFGLIQHLAHLAEVFGLAHVETGELGKTDLREIGLEVDASGTHGCSVEVHLVEGLEGVTVFLVGVLGLGQTGFKIHNHFGELGRGLATDFVITSIGKLGFHQGDVCLAQLRFAALAFQVVVTLTHAYAGLVEPSDALVGIVGISLVEEGKEWIDAYTVQTAHLGLKFIDALDGGNFVQVRHDGFSTLFLDSGSVHTHRIESGNLVAIAAGVVLGIDERINKGTQLFLIGLGQHIESTIAAVFSIQWMSFQPSAASVVIEILGRVNCRVQVVQIDTRGQLGTLVTSCNSKER